MRRDAASRASMEPAFAAAIGFAAVLFIGAVSRIAVGGLGESRTLVIAAAVMCVLAAIAAPRAAPVLVGLGWIAVMGFSEPPFGQLDLAALHPWRDGLTLAVLVGAAMLVGVAIRTVEWMSAREPTTGTLDHRRTLESMRWARVRGGRPVSSMRALATALSRRRQLLGFAMALVLLPLVTAALVPARSSLALIDELLIYLIVIVAVSLIGGLVPAVLAAVAASLLLNWFFTPPLHDWTIAAPENLLGLLLFVLVAIIVSATVHVAARRAALAARSNAEAAALLALARTVLSGDDGPAAIVEHLTATTGLSAQLRELVAGRWVIVAVSGPAVAGDDWLLIDARSDLQLRVAEAASGVSRRVLDGFAAQAAAALDRQRLRIQASQTETLAEGNRIRTALLAAVSHDLRTPLASVKASVSSMRQADLVLSEQDRAELLATIEEGADRLDALIGNLLDLSRLQTGSLDPLLRATSVEEVGPMTLRGVEHGERVLLEIPEDLPMVRTDPGLLDRVLANLISNALRFSPPDAPPTVAARVDGPCVLIEVIDHGVGVPAESHDRIFEAFQRLGDRHGGGVGLGLAVAKGFTEAMGGSIAAIDTPGGGLTTRVWLPIARSAHERDPQPSSL